MGAMVMVMAMVTAADMAMEAMDIMGTMARGRLRLPLLLSQAMDMVMDMAMDIMDTMARGRLRLLLLLSLAMDMVMDMDLDMVMEAMEAMDIMVTMARDLLMLSPDMDTMVIM